MSFAHKVSKFNRERKWILFKKYFPIDEKNSILDVGFTDKEHNPSANFLEKHYPYLGKITALGVETPEFFSKKYPEVKAVQYDGNIFPFKDKEFDICWSNAVIEHVGNRDKQLLFLKEMNRTAKSVFFTTPNKYFPVEVHSRTPLLHYLPKNVFYKYLTFVGKQRYTGDYMNLLSYGDIKGLLKDAGITKYTIVRNRLLLFTLDFVVILN
jgi:SAM-dependent methyltransferase